MENGLNSEAALAALAWQVELGADECIGEAPVNRYELAAQAPAVMSERKAAGQIAAPPVPDAPKDPVAVAEAAARGAADLGALRDALAGFELCALKRGARSLVFADGHPGARVMIIGEAPGREEDRVGRPFVGRAGHLLDRMLAAISLDRSADDGAAVYITNVLPWRPPQNRDPKPEEIAILVPFLRRHVALAAPVVVVLMGNIACQAVLGRRGITRLRGTWNSALDLPVLPMFHPAYLLRNPQAKREAWADLLELRARLDG